MSTSLSNNFMFMNLERLDISRQGWGWMYLVFPSWPQHLFSQNIWEGLQRLNLGWWWGERPSAVGEGGGGGRPQILVLVSYLGLPPPMQGKHRNKNIKRKTAKNPWVNAVVPFRETETEAWKKKQKKKFEVKSLDSNPCPLFLPRFRPWKCNIFYDGKYEKQKKHKNKKKQRGGPQALILNLVAWFFLSLYFNSTTQNPHSLKMHHFVIVSFDVERKYDSPI